MKWVCCENNTTQKAEIVGDAIAGFYLNVYMPGKSFDYLHDTFEQAVRRATRQFGVAADSWLPLPTEIWTSPVKDKNGATPVIIHDPEELWYFRYESSGGEMLLPYAAKSLEEAQQRTLELHGIPVASWLLIETAA